MLTETERAEIDEATTDVAFWLNGFVVVCTGGGFLLADRVWHPIGGVVQTASAATVIAGAVVAGAVWLYRQLIGAAIRWGLPVRAAFDMHRFELYDHLGVRRPTSKSEDNEVGDAINALLVYGEPLDVECRAASSATDNDNSGRDDRAASVGR